LSIELEPSLILEGWSLEFHVVFVPAFSCIPTIIVYAHLLMHSLRITIIREALWLIKPGGRGAEARKR